MLAFTRILLLVSALMLSAGCQIHEKLVREQELRQASSEWDKLFNAGDAPKLATVYAEEAVSMPPGSAAVLGRKAIQTEFESFFASNVARHETSIDTLIDEGNLAIEVAHYRLTSQPRAGGSETVESGKHIECRRRIDGEWKIVAEIWNTDAPAPK